jgi:DNA polymerase elongation subunit (family B)
VPKCSLREFITKGILIFFHIYTNPCYFQHDSKWQSYSRGNEKIEVLKHYFGITFDNELVVRGIEIRRHDTPNFIKQFQTQFLYTLFDCKDSSEIATKGYENALLHVTQAIDTIVGGRS